MIKCNIQEYYDYFINAGKIHYIPQTLLNELEKLYIHRIDDSIWKAPEQLQSYDFETKNKLGEMVVNNSNNGKESC